MVSKHVKISNNRFRNEKNMSASFVKRETENPYTFYGIIHYSIFIFEDSST